MRSSGKKARGDGQSVDVPSDSSVADEAERLAAEAERQVKQLSELLSFLRDHRVKAYPQEHGKFRWSVAEEAVCRKLLEAGVPLREIAGASGRTQSALLYRLEPQSVSSQESSVSPLGPVPAL